MKLHLGCGQRYLDGYINVDFPLSEHSVQVENIADINADISSLRYPISSISEVRLHHVFEHFTRPVACALVASWSSWLVAGGRLHLEVPDLRRTARAIISPFGSQKRKAVAERHLFGSHEAHWAAHYEAYSPALLRTLVELFGFVPERITKNAWRGTYNFELLSLKGEKKLSKAECASRAEQYLSAFLLDSSETEQRLLNTWMKIYSEQVERSWAIDA